MFLALATGDKIGLGVVAGLFIAFALASALLIPRYRPGYPGRGLRVFILVSLAFFLAMMGAVQTFGKEDEEEGGHEPAAGQPPPPAGGPARRIAVAGSEFRFRLPQERLSAGRYTFVLRNEGQVEHDLVVEGPNVEDAATEVIGPGESSSVTVDLSAGSYTLYCSVPGHREAGMETELSVG